MGMVMSGTMAVRTDPMSATTTTPTSRMVSMSVMNISRKALRMYLVTS